MNFKNIRIVFLFAVIMSAVFLYPRNPNENQIVGRMASSIDNVKFYGFDTNITFRNSGYRADRYLDIIMTINGVGRIDIKNKIAKLAADVNISSNDFGSKPYSEKRMEMYIVNDTIYTIPFGAWVKNNVQPSRNIWSNQTQIKQQLDIVKNAELNITGEDAINGVMAYHIDVKPDKKKIIEYIFKNSGAVSEVNYEHIENLTGAISTIKMDLWISKNEYLPLRSVVYIETRINNITSDMMVVTNFYDYNKESRIELPDLSNAVDIRG